VLSVRRAASAACGFGAELRRDLGEKTTQFPRHQGDRIEFDHLGAGEKACNLDYQQRGAFGL
jgi:hypothetical protein